MVSSTLPGSAPDLFGYFASQVGFVPTQSELDAHFGYVYRIVHSPTGSAYVGKHSHTVGENFQSYRGGGVEWRRFKRCRPWSEFSKSVLRFADSPEDLCLFEKEEILRARLRGDKLLNEAVAIDPVQLVTAQREGDPIDLDLLGRGGVWKQPDGSFRASWRFRRPDGTYLRIVGSGPTPAVAVECRARRYRDWLSLSTAPTLF